LSAGLHRPLLAPWYRLAHDGDRLLLEHGRSVVVMEGGAVRVLLPALLPLLDGTRTLDEVVEALGGPARPAIEQALERLVEHGLVVEGPPSDSEGASSLSELYGLAPALAAERLEDARLGVIGRSPIGAQAARLLRRAGLANVARLSADDTTDVDLVLVAPAPDEVSLLGEWNRRALESGTCWIGVRPFDGLAWSIGPLAVPGESCCYECLLLRLASHLDYGRDLPLLERLPAPAVGGPALELVVVGVLVQIALGWMIGRDTSLPAVLHVVEARPGIAVSRHRVLRVPRCGACSSLEQLAPRLPWHEAVAPAEAPATARAAA
jgi:bacteriocin biosynthesis cyclodehydratase domain-containing protein